MRAMRDPARLAPCSPGQTSSPLSLRAGSGDGTDASGAALPSVPKLSLSFTHGNLSASAEMGEVGRRREVLEYQSSAVDGNSGGGLAAFVEEDEISDSSSGIASRRSSRSRRISEGFEPGGAALPTMRVNFLALDETGTVAVRLEPQVGGFRHNGGHGGGAARVRLDVTKSGQVMARLDDAIPLMLL